MLEGMHESRGAGSQNYLPARPGEASASARAPRRVGDVVRLASGGPAMVVEELIQDAEGGRWLAGCRWFACRHQQQTGTFDAALLIPADPEDDRLFGYDVETDF